MSEKAMRQRVCRDLKPFMHPIPVENSCWPGTPDLSITTGWIELKWMKAWPKIAADAPVLIDHYTPQQRIWAQQRHRAGGNVWLMLQVKNEFLLFTGCFAAEALGRVSQSALRHGALKIWPNGYDVQELIEWLSTPTI